LIAYFPWREEDELTNGFLTAQESFLAKSCTHISLNNQFANAVEAAVHEIQSLNEIITKDYIAPFVAPNTEHIAAEDNNNNDTCIQSDDQQALFNIENEEIVIDSDIDLQFDNIDNVIKEAINISAGKQEGDDMLVMTSSSLPDAKFNSLVESLNSDQKSVFEYIKEHACSTQSPFHLFISGQGGTGKSYIISVIKEYIQRTSGTYKATMTTDPTGVAAFNIQGVTLHRALCLPVEHRSTSRYTLLSAEKLSILRQFWNEVNTLIIDEISMVPYETFLQIHLRLNVINGIEDSNVFFGGLNIIAVGDFFQLPPPSTL